MKACGVAIPAPDCFVLTPLDLAGVLFETPLDKCLCTLSFSVKSVPSNKDPPNSSPRYRGSLVYLFPVQESFGSSPGVCSVCSGCSAAKASGGRGPCLLSPASVSLFLLSPAVVPLACARAAGVAGEGSESDLWNGAFGTFSARVEAGPFNDLPRSQGGRKVRHGKVLPLCGGALRQRAADSSAAGAVSQRFPHFLLMSPLPPAGCHRLVPFG